MNKRSSYLTLFIVLILLPFQGQSSTFYTRVTGNWNTASTWSTVSCSGAAAATIPGASDDVVICSGKTVTMNGNPANCLSLTVNGTANWTSAFTINIGVGGLILNNGAILSGSSVGIINVTGALTQPAGASSTIGGVAITVSGTTTLSGTLSFNNTGGSKTFSNLVINSGASFTSTVAETYTVLGNLTMNGGNLTGSSSGILNVTGSFIIPAGAIATMGNINITITGLTSISGTLRDNSSGGANTFGNVNLNATGKFDNSSAETYTVNGTLNTFGGDFLATGATPTFNIAGDFNVVSGICDLSRIKINVSGNTTISGTLDINNVRGTKVFNNFTVNAGGFFNSVVAESYRINGNIFVNGTFNANLGVWTLSGGSKTIGGSTALIFDDITCNGSYTNNANLKLTSSLKGTGSWAQGATGSVDLAITNANFSVNIFNASAVGNTVIYSRAGNQNVILPNDGSYSNLTVSGGSTKTMTSATIANRNVLISASTTLDANNLNLNVGGNFTNNSSFVAGTGTVTMNGTIPQSIAGTTTTAFRNLMISNSSASVSASTNFSVVTTLTIGASAILEPSASVLVSGAGTMTGTGTARVTRIAATPDFVSQYTIAGKTLSGLNIDYIGAGNQNVNTLNYGSLTVSTNGTRTVTFPAAIVGVANVFSPSSLTTTYVVTGNTINFNGTVAQTIPAFNYNHLTSSSTGTRVLASSGSIGVSGVFTPFTNTYTISGSTLNFNGTVAQTIPAFNYFNLTSSSTGSRTLPAAGIVGIASSFTPGANIYTVTNSTINFNGTISQFIPAFTYNNLISAGSNTKILSGNIIVNNDLTISSNLDVSASNFSISIKRNWINNGVFNAQNGAIVFNGSAAQTLSGTGTTTFNQLDVNNSSGGVKLLTGAYVLNSVINPLNGNFNTNGLSFTMVSDASKTARIGQVAPSASLSGNFIIQRFITARDTSYADLSSTVQAATINDWDNELPAISYIHSPPTAYASAYTYDETADVYSPVTSSGSTLNAGKGYEVFLAGDYSYGSLPNTTMNVIGIPNQGNQNLSALISNNVQGWNLVGNPFASNVSWASIYAASGGAASGLYDFVEMYDYTIGDWNGYTSADGIEIGSAQGFWVYGLPGATSLTLQVPESAKTTTSNSSIKAETKIPSCFTLKISSDLTNFSHAFKVAAKEMASDNFDAMDLPFRASPNKATPALFTTIDGVKVNLNTFNAIDENYSTPLSVKVNTSGNYKISASGFDFMKDYSCIQLEDKLRNRFINLSENNVYEFEMKIMQDEQRFVLHFNKNGNCREAQVQESIVDEENAVEVLSTPEGNVITFSYNQLTSVSVSVHNLLGQNIVEKQHFVVDKQTETLNLPEDYRGLYFIKIESEKETIVKKFFKK